MADGTGLIRSVQDAWKWLETRGWILTDKLLDCAKIVNILVTAALTPKPPDLKNAALDTTFLLDTDIADHVSISLANVVATKALGRIEEIVKKLGSTNS
ncbi:hypothetical protein C0989_007284 [Termitomyces sp. Mn162]|nr:hypothetical protein C0989_007284 [Termitomyces sp. Mn162]